MAVRGPVVMLLREERCVVPFSFLHRRCVTSATSVHGTCTLRRGRSPPSATAWTTHVSPTEADPGSIAVW